MSWPLLLADLAAGVRCRGCGRHGYLLCGICARTEEAATVAQPIDAVDRLIARWAYKGRPRDLILELKIRGVRLCAGALADGVADAARASGVTGAVICWVPGRRRDSRARGFDHAQLLALETARRLGLELAPLLARRSDPPDQTLLSAADRHRNLRGVFVARSCSEPVIVVDDLVTTGSTASACAHALRRAGAPRVEVLVPCRA